MGKNSKTQEEYVPAAPFPMSPVSNGEWCPYLPNDKQILAAKLVAEETEIRAKRLGMTRRQFLTTAAGTATTFMVLNRIHGLDAWGDNSPLPVREEQTTDLAAATELLDHDHFVVDVQTHHLDSEDAAVAPLCEFLNFCDTFGAALGADCSELACPEKLGQLNYIKELFIDSKTSVGVISGVPNGAILGPQLMADTRDLTNQLAGSERTLMQAMIDPKRAPGQNTSVDSFEHQVNDLAPGRSSATRTTATGAWTTKPSRIRCFRKPSGWASRSSTYTRVSPPSSVRTRNTCARPICRKRSVISPN